MEAFKAYIDNRKRIENELIEWGEGSYKNKCSSKTMKQKSRDMLCLYMDGSFGSPRDGVSPIPKAYTSVCR